MVAHPTDTVLAADDRRAGRFHAQRVLWSISSRPRGRCCGLRASGGSVELRRSEGASGAIAGFAGLQTCGSVWACPVCSARILAERQNEVARAVAFWMLTGGRVAFLTFTVRHHAKHTLATVWDAVQAAHAAMTSGRAYQADKARLGVATTRVVASGARKGQTVPTDVLPWLRVVEVTQGANGWHVHQHMLVFLPAGTSKNTLADLYGAWHGRWSLGARSAGLDGSLMVNVAKFVDSSGGIGSYVTKNTYTPAEVAGLEVARGDLKVARFGNRSAMQLLRDVVDGSTGADRALWAEFETVSAGRRQMTWAGGARDLLNLGAERDDEQIAAEEVGSGADAVCLVDPKDYRTGIALVGRRATLLDALEVSPAAAFDLLDRWGVPYRLPSLVERRSDVLDPGWRERRAETGALVDDRDRDRFVIAAVAVLAQAAPRPDVARSGCCDICHERLAPQVRDLGRHLLCH